MLWTALNTPVLKFSCLLFCCCRLWLLNTLLQLLNTLLLLSLRWVNECRLCCSCPCVSFTNGSTNSPTAAFSSLSAVHCCPPALCGCSTASVRGCCPSPSPCGCGRPQPSTPGRAGETQGRHDHAHMGTNCLELAAQPGSQAAGWLKGSLTQLPPVLLPHRCPCPCPHPCQSQSQAPLRLWRGGLRCVSDHTADRFHPQCCLVLCMPVALEAVRACTHTKRTSTG